MIVIVDGRPVQVGEGTLISDVARVGKPCGGHGKFGKCRVTVRGELSPVTATERQLLSEDDIRRGVRLACLSRVTGECEIITSEGDCGTNVVTEGISPEAGNAPLFSVLGIAVDIGTTTLAARLFDTEGNVLSEAAAVNPQSVYGADVISRIEAAISGESAALAACVRKAIDGLINVLAGKAGVMTGLIDGAVITGNTVMLSLLTETSVEPFSHAPFRASALFGETVSASSLSLETLKPGSNVYIPPCISAFVGADITCAILSSGLCEGDTALLADIGTNGELAVYSGGRLTVCSTAAGPAFEGVGISMGMQGAPGAIDRVGVENGKIVTHVIGGREPRGICGSGLVDAAACMLETGALDEGGYLEDDPFVLSGPVVLTQKDVRMLQLAKSAIYGGIMTLLDHERISSRDVRDFIIAGGFGYYLDPDSAGAIGLIPRAIAGRARAVGNAALSGASVLLLDTGKTEKIRSLAAHARVIDLSANPVFEKHYVSGMMFADQE